MTETTAVTSSNTILKGEPTSKPDQRLESPGQWSSGYTQGCRFPQSLWITCSSKWPITQTGHISTGVVSQVPNAEENHFCEPAGICWCRSASFWPSPPGLPGCWLQNCFPGSLFAACSGAWAYSTFALSFVELHEVSVSLFHQLAEMSLNSSPTFHFLLSVWCHWHTCCESFCLVIHAISKNIKRYQALYQTLRNATQIRSPVQALSLYSFSGTAQPHFFTSLVVHPSTPELLNLTTTVLQETV